MTHRSRIFRALRGGSVLYQRADAWLDEARAAGRALVGELLRHATTGDELRDLSSGLRERAARPDGFGVAEWRREWLSHRLPPSPARILLVGGGAELAAHLGDAGYLVDCLAPSDGLAGRARAELAAAAAGRARARAELAASAAAAEIERRAGERRKPAGRRTASRGEVRRSGDGRRAGEARAPRGRGRARVEEVVITAALESLALAILDGGASASAALAGRRYDAAVIGDALGSVLDTAERVRFLGAIDALVSRGPILAELELQPQAATVSGRAERWGRRLGEWLARLRGVEAAVVDAELSARGFTRGFGRAELDALVAQCGRRVEWDAEPGAPHATLVRTRR